MHEVPDSPTCRARLSAPQRGRVERVRRSLAAARVTDLAALGAADLIALVERLRARLDDAVLIIDETTE
ncbi:hypothetical protein ACGFYY_25475 [Streptomyces sp. NPDC048331]|uniref:hypothetical protein n=1 Tax=Streptomyces sp. NPDC048331 TaxID=3365534 RepID=UPI0037177148